MRDVWRRRQERLDQQLRETWGDRLSEDALADLRDIVRLANLNLAAIAVWILSIIVTVALSGPGSGPGPAMVVVWLVGVVVTGVIAWRRIRAWNSLRRQVHLDLGLRQTPVALQFRRGPDAFDESVLRARAEAAATGGPPAITNGSGWERRLATVWGARFDAATVHAHRVRVTWLLAAILVGVVTVVGELVAPGPDRLAILVAGIILVAIAVLLYRRYTARFRGALARHLALPESAVAGLVLRRGLSTFDAGVLAARASTSAP